MASWKPLELAGLDFLGVYLPTLSVFCVSINKDSAKTLPQLHYVKTKICYDPCFIDIEWPWQHNDAISIFTCICISRYYEFFFSEIACTSLRCLGCGKVWTNYVRAFWRLNTIVCRYSWSAREIVSEDQSYKWSCLPGDCFKRVMSPW